MPRHDSHSPGRCGFHPGRCRTHRRPCAPHAADAPARPGAWCGLRRAVAEAGTPAAQRQLQGARHVQPHAGAAAAGCRRGGGLGRQCRHCGGDGCACTRRGLRGVHPRDDQPGQARGAGSAGRAGGAGWRRLCRRPGSVPAAPAGDRRAADACLRPGRGGGRRRHAGGRDRGRCRPARPCARQRGWRRPDRRHRGLVGRARAGRGAGAGGFADPACSPGRRLPGRCGGWRRGGRCAGCAPHRQHRLARLPAPRRGCASGGRRRHPGGAATAVA